MAIGTISTSTILLNGYNISGYSNQVEVIHSRKIHDKTNFLSGEPVERLQGMYSATVDASGYVDRAVGNAPYLSASTVADSILTVTPITAVAGVDAVIMSGVGGEYTLGAPVDELYAYSFKAQSKGAVAFGYVADVEETESPGTTYSAGLELGAVISTNAIYGAIHVTAITATSMTVVIQSSEDESGAPDTYVTRATFTALTAIGGGWKSYSTNEADTWWRMGFTQAGAGVVTVIGSLGLR